MPPLNVTETPIHGEAITPSDVIFSPPVHHMITPATIYDSRHFPSFP